MRAARRCTAPINAPGPPPTMPRRRRRCMPSSLDSAGMFTLLSCRKPQHSPVGLLVRTGFCKVVEGALGDLNDVPLDKRRAFPRALLAALQATFPFEHCPTIETVLRQFGKDAAEIHLPVAQRPEAPHTLDPRLVSAIKSLAARRAKLRVFHVKHFHAGVVDVEKREVIELLENKVAGIEQNVAAFVPAYGFQKPIEGHAV